MHVAERMADNKEPRGQNASHIYRCTAPHATPHIQVPMYALQRRSCLLCQHHSLLAHLHTWFPKPWARCGGPCQRSSSSHIGRRTERKLRHRGRLQIGWSRAWLLTLTNSQSLRLLCLSSRVSWTQPSVLSSGYQHHLHQGKQRRLPFIVSWV